MKCKWVVREGTYDTFWAHTPCKDGFNYLSKVKRADENQKKRYKHNKKYLKNN